ncbi:hypothetical protein E6W39_23265 [Kitasatospora acidiphila]|uniref:Transmembrane transport protein n=1 Tax=Kitasatospora acidiphila TaxID=2567942 RepID=A0A540W6G7_9ACTN|nr:hypothetical protein [Kitasatospora acidiphila]TQF04612.1 hypothetical protein E6W39_23265 [Kitasatospora acidiphila]
MIWLTWRQFRVQALVALGAVLLLAGYLAVLGRQVHTAHADALAHCAGHDTCAALLGAFADHYRLPTELLGYLLLAVPGILGAFWGAPLIARELENGTHRLVWNQSVTRGRWLAAKFGVVGLLSLAVTGLFSLLLGWATGPVTAVIGNRFEPEVFAASGLAPLGYTAFSFVLGATAGLFCRRTVPAMAATLLAFTVLQVATPALIRPHYETPVHVSVPLTADLIGHLTKIGTYGDIDGLRVPGGPWLVTTTPMLDPTGNTAGHAAWFQDCMNNSSFADLPACLAKGNLHVDITEQPAARYWTFQYAETALFTTLAALLAALATWRIRRRLT